MQTDEAARSRQFARLKPVVETAQTLSPFYRQKFGCLSLQNWDDFTRLPFTTKSELAADQVQSPPYGTLGTQSRSQYVRLCQTSGTSTGKPLRWLDTRASWEAMLRLWQTHFDLMHLTAQDRAFFPFSFGPFLGFWTAFEAASQFGMLTLPGGGMPTTTRLRFLLEHEVTVVFCTPTYALHLADVAADEGLSLATSAVRAIVVAGEPGGSIPATRTRIESAWGARLYDHYGMTEIGPAASECHENPGGLHVLEEDFVAEVLDPTTGLPVRPGESGELILTNLFREGRPLIRYRTGDIVRRDEHPCSCGRSWLRLLGGVWGRTDDMIHVRGNNVYPSAIEAVVRRFPEVIEYRILVDRSAPLAGLRIELESRSGPELAERVAQAIRDELLFRVPVTCVLPGTLPRFEMKARRVSEILR